MDVILLTGEKGAGKTSACVRLVATAKAAGLDCAGLVSPAVYRGEVKVGIDVEDVRSGERRRLADVDDLPAGLRLGPFRFHEDSLDWARGLLDRACPCDLLVVDEIGPLEVERGEGWANAFEVLRRGHRGDCALGVAVVVARPALVAAVEALLPGRVTAVVRCSDAGPMRPWS